MESRTYLEGSRDTDEVQILLLHSFSCGVKGHIGLLLSSLYKCSCICSNPSEREMAYFPLTNVFHSVPILEKASDLKSHIRRQDTRKPREVKH
jgi:hypothetical protein